jgi:hypothetical protein
MIQKLASSVLIPCWPFLACFNQENKYKVQAGRFVWENSDPSGPLSDFSIEIVIKP